MDIVDFVTGLTSNYSHFFSFAEFWSVIANPVSLGLIGSLIVLEGLLSADNSLVLAILVKHLPMKQQKRALIYGIFGAYFFRFVAIGLGTYLIQMRSVKILGGLYLLWLAGKYFFSRAKEEEEAVVEKQMGFWRTVVAVELMDIAFSVDSILAAFGVSEQVWILYLGGIIGILMMRGVAQIFLELIEKYPEIETTAYVLIALIGAKMMGAAFGIHVNDTLFFSIMIAVFLGTFVIHCFRKPAQDNRS